MLEGVESIQVRVWFLFPEFKEVCRNFSWSLKTFRSLKASSGLKFNYVLLIDRNIPKKCESRVLYSSMFS